MDEVGSFPMKDAVPDFRGVKGFEEIQTRFISAACSIVLQYEIVCDNRRFDITALELYLKLHKQRHVWWDPATDRDDQAKEQFNRGTWYVRQKKGPRYWRIDITAGNCEEKIQSGILIRQLDSDGGPGSALSKILCGSVSHDQWGQNEFNLIKEIHGKRIDGSDGSPLKLKRRDVKLDLQLGKGKRIRIPANGTRNYEGISTQDAALRVAIKKKYSADEIISC